MYRWNYTSPLGNITLTGDAIGLTDLQFNQNLIQNPNEGLPVIQQATLWLDLFFSGQTPDFIPPLHIKGTPFQQKVWQLLLHIPYGKTVTYGTLAKQLSPNMSAQAVGQAVGKNPIAIIIPCHRVIGANGNLTGYAYGLEKKTALLGIEKSVSDC